MIKGILSSFCLMLFAGCSHLPDAPSDRHSLDESTCKFDHNLLLSWGEFGRVGSLAPAPYLAKYSGCGKILNFIAANHTNDPDSPTFTLIEQILSADSNIGFVLVEGLPESYGISNSQVVAFATSTKGTQGDSETLLAVRRASDLGIAFQGAEPGDEVVLAQAERAGISSSDVFAFYVLRQIEQSVRSGQLDSHKDPRLQSILAQLLDSLVDQTGREKAEFASVSSLDGFKAWYRDLNGEGFNSSFRYEDVYPTSPQHARPSNSLSDLVSDIRDRVIIQKIEETLSRHQNVVVVYGSSHHDIQRPVLEAAFGPARIKSDF